MKHFTGCGECGVVTELDKGDENGNCPICHADNWIEVGDTIQLKSSENFGNVIGFAFMNDQELACIEVDMSPSKQCIRLCVSSKDVKFYDRR